MNQTSDTRWLNPRNNSLNLIRLVMALVVVYYHIYWISGRGQFAPYLLGGESLGAWAVFVFFMISGYLITGARLRSDGSRYLMNRITRIFPAFVAINVVTAFALAPIAYRLQNGTFDGFLTTPNTPLSYVITNIWLRMNDYTVAGTLAEVPYPGAWNGSLWSLYYEFVAYILVGLYCLIPIVRRSPWPMLVAFLASVALKAWVVPITAYASGVAGDIEQYSRLFGFFFGGALIYMLRDKLVLKWWMAALALAASIAIMYAIPTFGPQLSAPLLTYFIIWVGARLPSPRFFQVQDLSYGTYIWGFPLTQMAMVFGMAGLRVSVLTLILVPLTLVGAALSWFLVERPVMRWSRGKKHPFGEIRQEAR